MFIGSAEFISQISISITTFIFNLVLLERFGANGVAAFTIIGYVLFIQNMILTGIAVGIHPVISYNFGAKNIEMIFKLLKTTVRAVFLVGVIVFMVSFVATESIISIFSRGNSELLHIGGVVLLLTLPDRTLVKFIVRKFISYCLTERFRASNMQ